MFDPNEVQIRVAEAAENGAKGALIGQPRKPTQTA